jgi:hypothetical protein
MNTRLTWFVALLVVILTGHFILTALYNLQSAPVPELIRNASNRYTVPFFHQNWRLFAPAVPEYENQLEYRYPEDGAWTDWKDASAGNGFGPRSKTEYIEQTIAGALAWQIANNMYTRNQRKELDRIIQSFDYGRALYFVRRLHLHSGKPDVNDSIQVRVKFRFTPPPDKAYTFQTSYLEFPVYYLTPHETGN